MGAGATALREAIAADLPTLLALVHGAFEEDRGRLDPPSGAHAETIETLGRALRTGAALLVSVDGQPPAASSTIASPITSIWGGCPCCRPTGATASAAP